MNKAEAKKIVDAHQTALFNSGNVSGAELKQYQDACRVLYAAGVIGAAQSEMANAIEALQVVDGRELYAKVYPPREALVENLLYRGTLGILVAKPKSGKSWFTLQLAQAIDTGSLFLGRKTAKGRVLYLALEDGDRRIHERMHIRRWTPQNISFVFGVLPFDERGQGIDQVMNASAGYDFVVVDTLIATLTGKADENNNAQMGEIVNRLQRYTRDSNKSMMLTHHLTKGATEDPFDAVRGGGAIRAAYDFGLVIQRQGKEVEAKLLTESRDIPLEDMTMRFDGATGWTYEGDVTVYEGLKAGRKVVKALREIGNEVTTQAVADHMSISYQAALKQLQGAESAKLVVRDSEPAGADQGELLPDGKKRPPKKPRDLWSLAV